MMCWILQILSSYLISKSCPSAFIKFENSKSHQSLTTMCPFTLKIEGEDCQFQNMELIVNFAFRVLIRFCNCPTWPKHFTNSFISRVIHERSIGVWSSFFFFVGLHGTTATHASHASTSCHLLSTCISNHPRSLPHYLNAPRNIYLRLTLSQISCICSSTILPHAILECNVNQ